MLQSEAYSGKGAAVECCRLLLLQAILVPILYFAQDRVRRVYRKSLNGCGSRSMGSHFGVGEFTTHFRTYFGGDWDVHWGF